MTCPVPQCEIAGCPITGYRNISGERIKLAESLIISIWLCEKHLEECKEAGVAVEKMEESGCGEPCDSNEPCPDCEEYWNRMREEGFWKDGYGWTTKGLRERRKR